MACAFGAIRGGTAMSVKEAVKRSVLFILTLAIAILLISDSGAASNITYTYDGAGRLTKVDYGDGKTVEYTYDKAGNLLDSVVKTEEPPPPTTYALTVTKSGAGSGTVTSSPSGIDCGVDCSEIYNQGTIVTLTATPVSGSTFAGWGGDPDCSDGAVTMNANKSCTATFNQQAAGYSLTITRTGTGSGTITGPGISCDPDCHEAYQQVTKATLKASADPGSTFKEWSGACTGTKTTCKLTVNGNMTVVANFALPDLRGEWSNILVAQKTGYQFSGILMVSADEGAAPNVQARIYLSDDGQFDPNDTLLGSVVLGTIKGSASKSKKVKYTVTTNPSGKHIIAVIDPDNVIPESNESNNIAIALMP